MRASRGAPPGAAPALGMILGLAAVGLQGCGDSTPSQTEASEEQMAFVQMYCTHAANRTVQLRRREWIPQLWETCADYLEQKPARTMPHRKCLEVGARALSEVDSNSTAYMTERCLRVGHSAMIEDATYISEVIAGGDQHFSSFDGAWGPNRTDVEHLNDFVNQSFHRAKREADALSKKIDGMPKDALASFKETFGDAAAKDMVIYEWCAQNIQGGLQHQMRVDVIEPLFEQCSQSGAVAAAAEANGGPPRELVTEKCLEVAAKDIQEVAEKFSGERMGRCTDVVRKATAGSLSQIQEAAITLRRQMGADDDSFEQFREILARSKNETQAMLGEAGEEVKVNSEQKFAEFGRALDLQAGGGMPAANVAPTLLAIMAALLAMTAMAAVAVTAWRQARGRVRVDAEEPFEGLNVSIYSGYFSW